MCEHAHTAYGLLALFQLNFTANEPVHFFPCYLRILAAILTRHILIILLYIYSTKAISVCPLDLLNLLNRFSSRAVIVLIVVEDDFTSRIVSSGIWQG